MDVVVAGIDLGGKSGVTETALASSAGGSRPRITVLREDAEGRQLGPAPEVRRLTAAVVAAGARLVGIDAPLSLPHPVVCRDPDCDTCFAGDGDARYTARRADLGSTWAEHGLTASPMAPALLGALTFRGIYLRRWLEREGLAVIETWPRGVYLSLGRDSRGGRRSPDELPGSTAAPERYVTTMTDRLRGHAHLDDEFTSPHQIDAAAAALAAWAHATTPDDDHIGDRDGTICLCTRSL